MSRIVYLSWPATAISGGIKAAFQHVEILVEAGIPAVVATRDAARPGWFESGAPMVTLGQVGAGDVLVFPENGADLFKGFHGKPNRKLVFCQNPFLVHQGLAGGHSYADMGISHIMCPSHSVMHYSRRRFPGIPAAYTPFYLDHTRFGAAGPKTLQIAAVPRKRIVEYGAITDLFRANYPQHDDVAWVYLHKTTEMHVARTMGNSAVFLSLARLEAHGMTALEAMASGCIVAGFAGVAGGTDSATVRNGFWAAEDDVFGCVDQLARAVQVAKDRDNVFDAMVAEGRRTAWEYRREESARLLLDFWRGVLAESAGAPVLQAAANASSSSVSISI